MIQTIQKYFLRLVAYLFAASTIISCTDKWDEHYNSASKSGIFEKDILTVLKEVPSVSRFVQMLEISGFDKTIANSQAYTVWAPVNDALLNIDLSDTVLVITIVKNHIALRCFTTPETVASHIGMVNGKYIKFEKNGEGSFLFGNQNVSSANLLSKNGIVHIIEGYVPFRINMYEAMGKFADMSKVYNYIKSFELKTFDKENSIALYPNAQGLTVYDTAWIIDNIWTGLYGSIGSEDSVYTCFIPTNDAYNKAYAAYKPFFKTFVKVTSNEGTEDTALTVSRTKDAVLSDIVFNSLYTDINSLPDTLVSTDYNHIPSGAMKARVVSFAEVSNGYYYMVDSLAQSPYDKFYKNVSIEAENVAIRAAASTTLVYNRSSVVEEFEDSISGKRFIYMESSKSTDNPSIIYKFSNVLSAEYDIYCVVVPASAEDISNITETTKLSFRIDYYGDNGKISRATISKDGNGDPFVTHPTQIREILVAQNFRFPFSMGEISFQVSTAVASNETAVYPRKVRIDRILLRPSKN